MVDEKDKIEDTEQDTEPTSEAKTLTDFDMILADKPEPDTESKETEQETEEPEIPQEQMDAGYAAGLSEEAIKKLAADNPLILKVLADFHSRAKDIPVTEEVEEEPVDEFKPLDHVTSPEIDFKDEKVKKIFETVIGNQNQLIDQMNEVNRGMYDNKLATLKAQKASNQEFDTFVDKYMDSKVKEVPEIGLNRSLNDNQLKTRQGIFAVAKVLPNGTWQERLDTAVKMWKAKDGEGEAERKLAAKLDGQKKKFSPRPGGQKTAKDTRTAEEKTLEEMDTIAEKHGVRFGG